MFRDNEATGNGANPARSGTTGGGSGGGDDPFKVIAFTSGNQTPIGAWWVKAVTQTAKDNGWDLKMIQGDFDFQKMNPQVESAIGQGADAIFDGFTDVVLRPLAGGGSAVVVAGVTDTDRLDEIAASEKATARA